MPAKLRNDRLSPIELAMRIALLLSSHADRDWWRNDREIMRERLSNLFELSRAQSYRYIASYLAASGLTPRGMPRVGKAYRVEGHDGGWFTVKEAIARCPGVPKQLVSSRLRTSVGPTWKHLREKPLPRTEVLRRARAASPWKNTTPAEQRTPPRLFVPDAAHRRKIAALF